MKKRNIVKKKFEFNNIINQKSFVKNDQFIIYYSNNNINTYRFGISVGKKLGNAVFRNKYKRKIRSIVDNNKKYYQNDYDYIIIMRKGCISLDYKMMNESFYSLIDKINKRR